MGDKMSSYLDIMSELSLHIDINLIYFYTKTRLGLVLNLMKHSTILEHFV